MSQPAHNSSCNFNFFWKNEFFGCKLEQVGKKCLSSIEDMKLVEFTRCYEHTCRLKIVLVTGTGANEKLVAEYLYRVDQKPVLGQYCLNIEPKSAEISAKTVEKCFDIEEYVLPTFESEISFDQGERQQYSH